MMKQNRDQRIKAFISKWKDRGNEKEDTQSFWIDLFGQVLGIENPTDYLDFEKKVRMDGRTRFIDVYVPEVSALIEQKSRELSLNKKYLQSDGEMLTPFEQARRYGQFLPHNENPRWILTSNFNEIWIYDNNQPEKAPEIISLEELEKDWTRLSFLINKKDEHIEKERQISIQAGEIVKKLYDALLKEYDNPKNKDTLESLNILIVRLVFLFYAEDAGIFKRGQLLKYLEIYRNNPDSFRRQLKALFNVLDTPINERDRYMEPELMDFPYVNGGLFSTHEVEVPWINKEIIHLILDEASSGFDWSEISPTIFGALFESTLNPDIRHSGGMHYTSIENIHKVIDPLFLDDLKNELIEIKDSENIRGSKTRALNRFINKLASLKFLDPACGSGNFLTETYLSLRRLENEALTEIYKDERDNIQLRYVFESTSPIKVTINQLYGIEINDFAVAVTNTALFIAENQMMKETENILKMRLDFLPLQNFNNIHEGNALSIDWNDVVSANECNFIMGNPPFVSMKNMTDSNKSDLRSVLPFKKSKQLDYVAAWFFKAANFMKNTKIETAYVSSNSIIQGEQALTIWEPLFDMGIVINFAYTTFEWDHDAAVHCIIIGFSYESRINKYIINDGIRIKSKNINHHLKNQPSIFIKKRGKPLNRNIEKMTKGAQLIDGDYFKIGSEAEYKKIIKKYPELKPYIKQYLNAKMFLNNAPKEYVLYLEDCPPKILKNSFVLDRIKKVQEYRTKSKAKTTKVLADKPSHYFQSQVPKEESVIVPVVSSKNRKYIPMSYLPKGFVFTNALFYVDNASLYTFGILTSNIHNIWLRELCGRLKSDFRYSNTIVYNTFPWPESTEEQKEKIEKTAQNILNTRDLYPDSSLADLYDPILMPIELRKAHQENDRAVMEAYGWNWRDMTEEDCVAELMKLYQRITEKK